MNKYETLLKKYGALYKDFEDYRTVTEALAEEGTYIKNEALAELLEIKDKFDSLYKEHTVYCSAAEDVTVKLIETEKKYEAIRLALEKERDELKQRLEHINAMSNLEWKFEVVEETETTRTPYDKLVDFCNKRCDSCIDCPNRIACDGINEGLKPAKWNEDEIAEYNELMALCKEDK